jgi:hypothetical protein
MMRFRLFSFLWLIKSSAKLQTFIPCDAAPSPTNVSMRLLAMHCQCAFDDNLSVTQVFIKQILRAAEQAPPLPVQGGVGVPTLFFP